MSLYKFLIPALLLILLMIGCSEDNPLEPSPTVNKLSTFSEIQQQVFTPSCAISGCHTGPSVPNSGNLNLAAPNAYNQLVNQTSTTDPSKKLVEPNNSANSMLILRLNGTVLPRMPSGQPALSAATIDSIAKWIDQGALNN